MKNPPAFPKNDLDIQSGTTTSLPYNIEEEGHSKEITPSSRSIPIESSDTPMLKQYQAIKAKHKDCILFFRLGDFYEMFYEDAHVGSSVLDLVLTARGKGTSQRIPMCGIPYHASENYIAKLIKAGHKVAICEQVEDPALAKGIVKRDVIRVISAGTYLDNQNNETRHLLCLSPGQKVIGIAFIDPAQGTIQTSVYPFSTKSSHPNDAPRHFPFIELISRLSVYECIYPEDQVELVKSLFQHPLLKSIAITFSPYDSWRFNHDMARKSLREHFGVHNLHGFGIDEMPEAIASSSALLDYLKGMNKQQMRHVDKISLFNDSDYATISSSAARGLELDRLIDFLDHTLTPLGKRLFRFWFYHPLKNVYGIKERQSSVLTLKDNPSVQTELKFHLNKIPDIEKNISRLSSGYTHAKDLLALRNALSLVPMLQTTIKNLRDNHPLFRLDDIPTLREYLLKVIDEDIPLSHPEGKIIRAGYNTELDRLRDIENNGHLWLKNLQAEEVKRTRINSLKIGFNNIFGYYIEVTKTNLDAVPSHYIRKQTLVNAERFITPELKNFEEKILTAKDKILKIENEIIKEAREKVLDHSQALHQLCQQIATVDSLYSLSVLGSWPDYTLPEITEDSLIDIKEGRHPVVEKNLTDNFVPNDTLLDSEQNHLIILTGPNMAGKSTYIRQTAILVIMAQVGSFIPVKSARIGIVDKIFTRIGAHDDIARGQSTFMVEMNETADILNNMTEKSLVILDEIGRGTSTYDGLSLAWALAEHLKNTRVRTLFATHFHELTALADNHTGVKNYNVAVKEWNDEIIFLHKIIPGSTDDSYGIYVAKLAGIPATVLNRAQQILTQLELQNQLKENLKLNSSKEEQLSLFHKKSDPALEELKSILDRIDINALTPLAALNKLQELRNLIKNDKS